MENELADTLKNMSPEMLEKILEQVFICLDSQHKVEQSPKSFYGPHHPTV